MKQILLKRCLAALTAAVCGTALLPVTASAEGAKPSADALIEKYAEYGYAEAHAQIPAAGGILRSSKGADKLLAATVLQPQPDGTVAQCTLGEALDRAVPADIQIGIFALSDYRFDCKDNHGKHWQFFRDCRYENGFYYIASASGCASVVGCDTDAFLAQGTGTLTLPDTLGGMRVTRIEDHAFESIGYTLPCLTQIILPDTVETVGISAFQNAGGADLHIQLPQNLKAIQRRAFVGAEQTVSDEFGIIALPESLEFLGYEVFGAEYRTGFPGAQQSHYIIQMPQSPVYLDAASYHINVPSDDPAQTVRGLAAIYSDPAQYFGEATWALICWSRGELSDEEMRANFGAEWQDMLPASRGEVDFERTAVAAWERGRAYLNALAESGKYDIDRPFWCGGFQYNCGGSALYGEYNVVSKDLSGTKAAETPVLPGTDGTVLRKTAVGDLDQNGQLTIADAVMMARYIAEDSTLTVSAAGAADADLDGDGSVTSSDLAILLEHISLLNEYITLFADANRQTSTAVALPGDVDTDGTVDIADGIMLAQLLAEEPTGITAQGRANADLDGDGSVTAADYVQLLGLIGSCILE